MSIDTLSGGFSDPAIQSARAFRACLTALSRPGRIETLTGATPPAPLSVAAGVLAGAFHCADLRDWLTFHTGAPLVAASEAAFAFGRFDDLLPLDRFAIGTPEYPDRAATLVIDLPALLPDGAHLTGPGIKDHARLSLPATAPFQANHALFPLGFDAFLTCGDRLAGLPRSTIVRDA